MAGSSARLQLPRSRRITMSRDFTRVRNQGQRLAVGCLIANWLPLQGELPNRIGVITGKKIGGAVQRNRARRLLRESFRLHQHEFSQPVDLVLVARNSIVGKTFSEVEKDFLQVLRRGGLLKQT